MHECRKEIQDIIVHTWDSLDPTGSNSSHFMAMSSNMSDTQFFAWVLDILSDPKKHLYFEIEHFKNEPTFELIENTADMLGVKLFDYIAYPHLTEEGEPDVVSVNKIFTGPINIRRVQQMA